MPYRFFQIGRWLVSCVLIAALALPLGLVNCCGRCQGCETASQQKDIKSSGEKCCGCCHHQPGVAGCCQAKSQSSNSCCAKTTAHHGQQASDAPCICDCQSMQPADRTANSNLNAADQHPAVVVAWAVLEFGQSDRAQLEVASSPGELAPDIPHRILHCSWLN